MSVAAGLVYINSRLVPSHKARLSILCRGFFYGEGVFETLRIYSGKTFRLNEHLNRLLSSSKIIRLDIPYSLKELRDAVYKTIRANCLIEGSLRLSISQGGKKVYLVITTQKTIPYKNKFYKTGFKGKVVSSKQNEFSILSKIKSMNFLEHILARQEARLFKADEGILLNTKGYLAEGAVSNIFLVSGGSLWTPSEKSGILPGITRKAVLEIADGLALKTDCRLIRLCELKQADEAFLTNSVLEVMPLVELDNRAVGKGMPGQITQLIHHSYREVVKKELM